VGFRLYAQDGAKVSEQKFDRAGTKLVVRDPGLARLPAGVYFASVSVPGRPVSCLKLVRQ